MNTTDALSIEIIQINGLDNVFTPTGMGQLAIILDTPTNSYSTELSSNRLWNQTITINPSGVTFNLVELIDNGHVVDNTKFKVRLIATRKFLYFYDFGVEVWVQLFKGDVPSEVQLLVKVQSNTSLDITPSNDRYIIDDTLEIPTWLNRENIVPSRSDRLLNIVWKRMRKIKNGERNDVSTRTNSGLASPIPIPRLSSPQPTFPSTPSELSRSGSPIPAAPSPNNPVLGIIDLEVVAAINVRLLPRRLRRGFKLNAFAVASFGRESVRTAIGKATSILDMHATSVVWQQRARFSVKTPQEAEYTLTMALYHQDRLQPNRLLGRCELPVRRLVHDSDVLTSLSLNLNSESKLLIQARFIPYDVLRYNFWQVLARHFSHESVEGKPVLNRFSMEAMLESLGTSLTAEHIVSLFQERQEMSVDEVVNILERSSVKNGNEECRLVSLERCPLCKASFTESRWSLYPKSSSPFDIITHLAVCTARYQDSTRMDRLVMAGFVTEEYASRKWFIKLLSYMSYGNYRVGSNNGNILVQDRVTGKLVEERIPTVIRLGIRFLYTQNKLGRLLKSASRDMIPGSMAELKMARNLCASLTLKQGRKFDDPASVAHIPEFIRYHGIDLAELADPIDSYANFNQFFYRKLKPGARVLASPDPRVAVCPADCRLNCYQTINDATTIWIKGENFTLQSLLKDDNMAKYYSEGSIAICRLAPQDYHRFHAPVDGTLNLSYHIPGAYITVNPMAVRGPIDVYTENVRHVCHFHNTPFGTVTLVAVGAMMVGSICITAQIGQDVKRGDEVGYFAFGGSTLIALFAKGSISFDEDLLTNSKVPIETLVRVGNSLGTAACPT